MYTVTTGVTVPRASHTYVVNPSCSFLLQFLSKVSIEKLLQQLHVNIIIFKFLDIRVHRVRVGTYSSIFYESETPSYYGQCSVTVQYIAAFSEIP